MKKLAIYIGIIALSISIPVSCCFGEEIHLDGVEQKKIEIPKNDYKEIDSLVISEEEIMDQIIKLQREKDLEDIDNLWKGTVANNQVIGFALKKLLDFR